MFNITILGIISYGFLNTVHRISNKTGFIGLVSINAVLALSWTSIQPVSYWDFFCDCSGQVTVNFYFKLYITGRQPKNINKLYKKCNIFSESLPFHSNRALSVFFVGGCIRVRLILNNCEFKLVSHLQLVRFIYVQNFVEMEKQSGLAFHAF